MKSEFAVRLSKNAKGKIIAELRHDLEGKKKLVRIVPLSDLATMINTLSDEWGMTKFSLDLAGTVLALGMETDILPALRNFTEEALRLNSFVKDV